MKKISSTNQFIALAFIFSVSQGAVAKYGDYSNGRTAADNMSDAANSGNSGARSLVESSGSDRDSQPVEQLTCNESYRSKGESFRGSAAASYGGPNEMGIYCGMKDKSWEQLSQGHRNQLHSIGIENAETYNTWKSDQKETETFNQAMQQNKIYENVKNRSWDSLSSKEKKYANSQGIHSAEQFDAWKETHALIMEAKKQKDAKVAFNRIKHKSWSELSAADKVELRRKGIANSEQFEDYKDKQIDAIAKAKKEKEEAEKILAEDSNTNRTKDLVEQRQTETELERQEVADSEVPVAPPVPPTAPEAEVPATIAGFTSEKDSKYQHRKPASKGLSFTRTAK